MIRNAKERVRIASLYVGPATGNNDDCEEAEMLEALSELVERNNSSDSKGDKKVSIQIILDENRALRPVPIIPTATESMAKKNHDGAQANSKTTTSSAEAVARAIRGAPSDDGNSSSSLHLFRVLPPTTIAGKSWLPNPLDEIAGVFHIKIYIVDDQLLLSGANLSREYFRDRMDRYLHLVDGANGLVDFYAELVEILCRHSNEYDLVAIEESDENGNQNSEKEVHPQRIPRAEFLREITQHFQDPNQHSSIASSQDKFSMGDNSHNKIVAVGVPTFQAPAAYFRHKDCADVIPSPVTVAADVVTACSTFWSLFRIHKQPADKVDFVTDVDATLNLLKQAGKQNNITAQLSSAYLNPAPSLLSVLRGGYRKVELLTAGKISHGFKPKEKENKDGSQGKDWLIPSAFDKLVDECMSSLRSESAPDSSKNKNSMNARLFFWERPEWTFHAKGIWLTEEENETESNGGNDNNEIAAVVVGSSNFGYRSFYRDMESNLLLVFPPGGSSSLSPNDGSNGDIASSFGEEWKNLLASSKREVVEEDNLSNVQDEKKGTDTAEKPPPLPWPILKSVPIIKTFL
jgi:CDP-diacylglycerol--glycerol-3-phosphate 3-phosphatidyltransferase